MNNFNFSNNLKYLRSLNNLTQSELAKKVGVTKQAISSYETGKSEPNIFTLYKLASTFNCSIDSLIFNPDAIDINKFIKIDNLLSKETYSTSAIKALNEIKINLENKKIEIENSIFDIENALNVLNSVKLSKNEYADELSYNLNSKDEIISCNLNSNNKIISFLDKLDDRRYKQIVDISNDVNSDMSKLFIRGNVSAGNPNIALEQNNEYVNVPNKLLCPSKEYFILEVSGDSMNEIYLPGELLLIERTHVANNGDMVIALIDTDECTLKEYHKVNGTIYLYPHSTNSVHKVQEYSKNTRPCHIIGIVRNILEGATICEC